MANTIQQHDIDVMNTTIPDQLNDSSIDARLKLYENLQGGGLKYTFHGVVYQLVLLTYAAYRAHKNERLFYLISEAKEFEKFDDLVIDDHDKIIFLQAKHCSTNKCYSAKDFCKPIGLDDDASLAKYYDSWIRLKTSSFSIMDGKPKQSRYIFFTNRDISESESFLEDYPIIPGMDDFDFQNPSQTSKTLRFKKGESRQTFIDAIYAYSVEMNIYPLDIKKTSDQVISFDIEIDGQISRKDLEIQKLENEIMDLSNSTSDRNPNGQAKPKRMKYNQISIRTKALIALEQHQDLLDILDKKKNVQSKELKELFKKQKDKISKNQALIILTGALDHKINQFLDEFEIKIKQPSEKELQEFLQQEIKVDIDVGPRQIYHALNNRIINWFKDRNNCVLKWNELKKFIQVEVADIQHILRLGSNKVFEEEYLNSRLSFSNAGVHVEDLSAFLTSSTDEDNIAVVTGLGIRARVYATITSLLKDEQIVNSEWLFLDFGSVKDQSDEIFKAPSLKIVVVDCLQMDVTKHIDTIKSILKTATVNNKKKLVLLMNDDVTQAELTQRLKADENTQTSCSSAIKSWIKVKGLTTEQIQEICQPLCDMYLNLGGKDYCLKDIIKDTTSNLSTMISDLDFLCKIVSNFKKEPSTAEHPLPYGIYVQNDLIQGIPVYDLSDLIHNVRCQVIAVDNVKNKLNFISQLQKWLNVDHEDAKEKGNKIRFTKEESQFNDEEIKYILISDKHISNIQSYVQTKIAIYIGNDSNWPTNANYSFICLTCIDDRNAKVTSRSSEELSLPKPIRYDIGQGNKIDDPKHHFIQPPSNISIISAQAGYGKSSFCLATRQHWIRQSSSNIKWLIYILLPQLNLSTSESFKAAFTHAVTQVNWQNWETSLVLKDLESKSNVTLLLDAFDEVKDENHLKVINEWINQYSDKANIVVTTRPHALNKISLTKSNISCSYYGLKEYTPDQQSQYIREYINAILKLKYKINQEQVGKLIDPVSQQINQKLTSIKTKGKCLYGIPLESYHYCEIITPHVVYKIETGNQNDLDAAYAELENITTASLIQKFIAVKLHLFLEKHLCIPSTTISQWKHQIYGLTASYLELLMIFAYKQVFNLDYSFLSHYLRRYFYSSTMISDLNDTGLACVYQNRQFYIKFNHDTYQDYFAALFILKGILLISDQLNQDIKNTIRRYRYNPRYRILLSLAAHLSMTGDKIIPGFDASTCDHRLQLWQSVADESDDLLGAAETKLFHNCLREYNSCQRQALADSLSDQEWAQQLTKCINKVSKQEPLNSIDDGYDEQIPILSVSASNSSASNESNITDITAKNALKNKACVVDIAKSHLKNGSLSSAKLAKLFEEIIKDTSLNSYWDIDGGFSAMALLGNDFNQTLANYFIDRIKRDPSWRANPALNAIYSLYRDDLQLQSQYACLNVIPYFIKYYKHLTSEDQLHALINRSYTTIFDYYITKLPDYISNKICLYNDILDSYGEAFEYPILLFRSLLWIAMQVGYAVKIDENDQIQFTHESVASISLNNDVQSQIFTHIQMGILLHLKSHPNKEQRLKQDDGWTDLIKPDVKDELKNNVDSKLKHLTKEEINKLSIGHLIQYPKLTHEIYRKYQYHGLMTQNLANELLQHAKTCKNDRHSAWPRDGGIEAIGYIGRYFNEVFADFLKVRFQMYKDNHFPCNTALKHINKTLTAVAVEDRDDCYRTAMDAYSMCESELNSFSLNSNVHASRHVIP